MENEFQNEKEYSNEVLVLIDLQNDFIDGSLGSKDAQAIVDNVVNKIKEGNWHTIYCTYDTHYEDYMFGNYWDECIPYDDSLEGKMLPIKHCTCYSEGWQYNKKISEALDECGVEVVRLKKDTFGFTAWNGQFGTPCSLKIHICGLCTDICVVSNALILRAFYPNAEIHCDAKCCAGVTPEHHKNALDVMKSCQILIDNE